jgi:hypothetical protein
MQPHPSGGPAETVPHQSAGTKALASEEPASARFAMTPHRESMKKNQGPEGNTKHRRAALSFVVQERAELKKKDIPK